MCCKGDFKRIWNIKNFQDGVQLPIIVFVSDSCALDKGPRLKFYFQFKIK